MELAADDLARATARVLAPKFGSDLEARTDDVIAHGPPEPREPTRAAEGLIAVVEVAAFIVHCSHLALVAYQERKDLSELVEWVRSRMRPPPGMSGKQINEVLNAIVEWLRARVPAKRP